MVEAENILQTGRCATSMPQTTKTTFSGGFSNMQYAAKYAASRSIERQFLCCIQHAKTFDRTKYLGLVNWSFNCRVRRNLAGPRVHWFVRSIFVRRLLHCRHSRIQWVLRRTKALVSDLDGT